MATLPISNGGGAGASAPSLVLIATQAESLTSSDTKSLLSNALHLHKITDVQILGPSAQSLQALRTEAYTLAGKLSRNLSVTLHELPDGSSNTIQVDSVLGKLSNKTVRGVLVNTATPVETKGASAPSFLDLSPSSLQNAIEKTINLFHTVARITIPLIPIPQVSSTESPFFALHPSPSSAGHRGPTSIETQLQSLTLSAIAAAAPHVKVGYATDLLPAPPKEEKIDEKLTPKLGSLAIDIPANGVVEEEEGSPTKLWAEWALQEEMG
ncbi:Hypothetical protein D9617_16g015580 [Elsinoe fawcettii]|nr:Hypothetical protein D9617_16g015580 [Elsinoe fawcettii]